MAEIIRDYFTPGWRTTMLPCHLCGWVGTSANMVMEPYEELTDYACPACGNILLTVIHPDLAQVQQAAAAGNVEAQQLLALREQALSAQRHSND